MTTMSDEYEMSTISLSGDRLDVRIGGLGGFGTDRRPFLAWKLATKERKELLKGRLYLDQIAIVTSQPHRSVQPLGVIKDDPIFWSVKFGGTHKVFEITFAVDVNARDWLHKMTVVGAL